MATAADAVDTIVSLAGAHSLRIVGWSNFDRNRLVDIRPDLAHEIDTRYVNALKVARRWRGTVYPSFAIEREDHSPRDDSRRAPGGSSAVPAVGSRHSVRAHIRIQEQPHNVAGERRQINGHVLPGAFGNVG